MVQIIIATNCPQLMRVQEMTCTRVLRERNCCMRVNKTLNIMLSTHTHFYIHLYNIAYTFTYISITHTYAYTDFHHTFGDLGDSGMGGMVSTGVHSLSLDPCRR